MQLISRMLGKSECGHECSQRITNEIEYRISGLRYQLMKFNLRLLNSKVLRYILCDANHPKLVWKSEIVLKKISSQLIRGQNCQSTFITAFCQTHQLLPPLFTFSTIPECYTKIGFVIQNCCVVNRSNS